METLLLGVDAACRPVLDRLPDGTTPNIDRLLEGGATAPLESGIPPWTPSAWTTVTTGVNPGKHGVFGFLSFDGYDWSVVDATERSAHPLWTALDEFDRSSVILNVPVTSPPDEFDGALVPGYTAPDDPTCYPEGLLGDLRDELGEYRVYPRHTGAGDATRDEKIAEYRRCAVLRDGAFRYLVDRFDPDFGFLQFQVTDSVFHECPDDPEAVAETYSAVDAAIGRTLDACDAETVVLASDHGMGDYGGYEFRVNEFLRERGDVETATSGGMPSWAPVRDEELVGGGGDRADDDRAGDGPSVAERAVEAASRVGITSQRIGRVLDRLGLTEAVLRVVPDDVIRAGTEGVDFAGSRAYMRSRIELGIRLNVEGRDPEGVVPPDEYEATRDRLIDALSAVRTPDGDPVFEAVDRREAHFEGPRAEEAVDVVTIPAGFDQFLTESLRGEQFGPPSEPQNHKLYGILSITDASTGDDPAGASKALDDADPHIMDIAPTILATMDVPADGRMDGSVLPPITDAGTETYPPYEPPTAAGRGDDGAVENRLRDLGYVE